MARDDFDGRGRDQQRSRDDRYGQDIPPGREGGTDRDPYGGALYGQARGRDASRDRYPGSGDERDLGYGDDSPRRDRTEGSGRGGMGGGMGRESGGGYAGRPEDAARTVRYDRDDYDDGASRQGLRGGRGEGSGRDAAYDRDDARYDAYGADGGIRDRGREGTMGGSMGGNAGWREAGRDWHRNAGALQGGGWDRGDRGDRERADRERADRERADRDRWAREQWERSMHGDPRWERDYRGGSGSTGGMQRDLQSGGTMGDFGSMNRGRDPRSEYGGGMSGRPGGADEPRRSGGNWFAGAHGGAPDRNPGQGFGGYGYSNADEPVAHRDGGGRDYGSRDHSGRGPRNYQRSDDRIREDVCERLTRHREIDASDIDIEVRAGVVTLSGQVEDKHAKRLAEDIAEEVMGVAEVHNELKAARGGVLGSLLGRGHGHHTEERYEREVTRDASRDATREGGRDTGRETRAASDVPASSSDVGSVGATTVRTAGAAGAAGARNASEPTTPDASSGRTEGRRGRSTSDG